jgi:hypothetical protein
MVVLLLVFPLSLPAAIQLVAITERPNAKPTTVGDFNMENYPFPGNSGPLGNARRLCWLLSANSPRLVWRSSVVQK